MNTKGVITRKHVLTNSTQESTIDLVLLSSQLGKCIKEIVIDENQDNGLCRITKTKTGTVTKKSDHNPIITDLEIPWQNKVKEEKIEIWNFKNKECPKKFKYHTNESTYLTNALEGNEHITKRTGKLLKRFDKIIKRCFRKVRIKKTKQNELDKLFERWNKLRKGTTQKEKEETKIVEDELADKYSKEYYGKIKEATQDIDTTSGGYNSGRLWKLKRQMFPNANDPPTAMIDQEGNLQTEPEEIQKAATQEYLHRLRNRPKKQGLEDVPSAKEKLCEDRIKSAQLNRTPDWTRDELEKVLEHLKNMLPEIHMDIQMSSLNQMLQVMI